MMRKLSTKNSLFKTIWVVFFFLCIYNNAKTQKLTIIPEPKYIQIFNDSLAFSNGRFILDKNILNLDNKFIEMCQNLIEDLNKQSYLKASNKKQLLVHFEAQNSFQPEQYQLLIKEHNIKIFASSQSGYFYGLQTLKQMVFNATLHNQKIPNLQIDDQPQFGWRGLMLDISRHYFDKKQILQFIDNMVGYKYNILHLHLTDDEGWRIEIKSLPKLTEVGAWRANRIGKWANTLPALSYEPKNYGGFLTQNDIKEIVAYAGLRNVQILPEIDVPGHSMALVSAYPELSGTPSCFQVSNGAPVVDWEKSKAHHLIAFYNNTVSPAKPIVYEYLDKIFSEIAELFPFPYIHIGGDECPKNFWENDPAVQKLMQDNQLKTMDDVQSYFTQKVIKIINSKGKKAIGWDEILAENKDTTVAIMSWRGTQGGIDASKQKLKVVMSPTTFAYLDYYQGEKLTEPSVYKGLRMKTCYAFNPFTEGADNSYIIGGQANIWTEQIQQTRSLDYMVWPRAMAISEALWTNLDKKNWEQFTDKIPTHFLMLKEKNINFSTAMYDPIVSAMQREDSLFLVIENETLHTDVYYSLDGSLPDNYYPKYTQLVYLPDDVSTVKIIAYKKGTNHVLSKLLTIPIEELKTRIQK